MKTQNNKLDFNKNTMIELNTKELANVKGGSFAMGIGIALAAFVIVLLK